MKDLIVFVCKGNIHRSVVAEICLKQELEKKGLDDKFEVISRGIQGTAGTDPPKHNNLMEYSMEWSLSRPVLEELQIDVSQHRSMPIDRKIVKRACLIFVMDKAVLNELPNSLINQFPEHQNKMRFFSELDGRKQDMPDCGGSSDQELHQHVNNMIVKTIRENINVLIEEVNKND